MTTIFIFFFFQEQVQHTNFGVLSVRVYYNMDCEILSVEGEWPFVSFMIATSDLCNSVK